MNKTIRVFLAALLGVVVAACSTTKAVKPHPGKAILPEVPHHVLKAAAANGGDKYTPTDLSANVCLLHRTIYFDFDKTEIKPAYQHVLACHIKYLKDRPTAHVRLEGNTDERGTREYNLGLAERRAKAVLRAMTFAGVSPSQLSVISYGKEKPVCHQHNKACWDKNRRVEIVYTSK